LWRVGTPDYLRTLGVQLVEGRLFDDRDNADAPLAVVINQTMARKYLPHGAIGHRIRFGPSEPFYTIVGVVSDLRERGYELAMKPAVYVTTAQGRGGTTREYLIVRVAGDPIGVGNGVRAVVANVDPEQPLAAIQAMDEIVALDIADRGQQMRLLATFAGLAAFLAGVGLYGVLSYLVSQRRKEIGLRLALGATPSSVMRMVAARGAFLTAIGASLGLAVGWAGTQAMRSLLYGVSPSDPLTFAGMTVFFGSVAFVAMYVPARRATKVDPMVALRCE